MKRCVWLFVIFQALDILTTVVGMYFFGLMEMNWLINYTSIVTLILFKVAIIPFVVIIIKSRPYIRFHNAVWIVSAVPVLWNFINIAAEIIYG